MDSLKSAPARFLVLCLGALAAASSAARADLITPDSIPQPPPFVGSAPGTPIPSPADLVTSQYVGLGLLFPFVPAWQGATFGHTAAVIDLSGAAVWSPAYRPPGAAWQAGVGADVLTVQLVRPGTTMPATISSLTVEVLGLPDTHTLGLEVTDPSGRRVGFTQTPAGVGPHGGELLTLSGADISSFDVAMYTVVPAGSSLEHDLTPQGSTPMQGPWGIAGIEFTPTPTTAPEPGALALAGVGALALAGWAWRCRRVVPAV